MTPTLTVVLVTGPGLAEPKLSLHTKRSTAADALALTARELLTAQLGYVPLQLAEGTMPDPVTVTDLLAGYGYTATLDDQPVTL